MEATVVAQELVGSHLSYARSVLLGPPAAVARGVLYPSSGVLAILATIGQAFAVVILLHATLPSPTTPSLQLCRLSCLAFLLALLFPIAFDRERFSLGGDFRDIAIPSFVWLPLAEALKICLVSIWQSPGERAPHWIVPEDKARHWPGAVKIDALPGAHRRSSVTSTYSTRFRVPQVWYRVPHPPLWSWRRLAWALDNLALRRPGTSWLLPSEQRAMEWGYKPIVAAAAVYDDAAAMQTSEREKCKRRREADIWFGQLEWGWIGSSLQLLSLIAIFRYIRSLDMRVVNGPFTLGHLSLMDQYLLTLGLGCIVAFTFSPIEYLLYPILLHVFGFPATAISPTFQRPLISSGPTEFWSRRWHQWLRRDFSTLARLFPGGSESRRLRALWTFSVSAMEHNFVFSRFQLKPPTAFHAVWLFFVPPLQLFFVSQGLLIMAEQTFLGPRQPTESLNKKIARRCLLWIGLLTTGRWVTGYLISVGAFDPVEFFNWPKVVSIRHDILRERAILRHPA